MLCSSDDRRPLELNNLTAKQIKEKIVSTNELPTVSLLLVYCDACSLVRTGQKSVRGMSLAVSPVIAPTAPL